MIGEDIDARDAARDRHCGACGPTAAQIEQVVMNLVVNARDAMPDGGVLAISTRRRAPRRALRPAPRRREPGLVRRALPCSDTGVGWTRRRRAAHLRAVLHDEGEGEGHGPRVWRRCTGSCEQSGGHIWRLQRAGPRDDASRSILPQVAAAVPAKAEHVSQPRCRAGRRRCCVVEDEDAVRAIVRRDAARSGLRDARGARRQRGAPRLRPERGGAHRPGADAT